MFCDTVLVSKSDPSLPLTARAAARVDSAVLSLSAFLDACMLACDRGGERLFWAHNQRCAREPFMLGSCCACCLDRSLSRARELVPRGYGAAATTSGTALMPVSDTLSEGLQSARQGLQAVVSTVNSTVNTVAEAIVPPLISRVVNSVSASAVGALEAVAPSAVSAVREVAAAVVPLWRWPLVR